MKNIQHILFYNLAIIKILRTSAFAFNPPPPPVHRRPLLTNPSPLCWRPLYPKDLCYLSCVRSITDTDIFTRLDVYMYYVTSLHAWVVNPRIRGIYTRRGGRFDKMGHLWTGRGSKVKCGIAKKENLTIMFDINCFYSIHILGLLFLISQISIKSYERSF